MKYNYVKGRCRFCDSGERPNSANRTHHVTDMDAYECDNAELEEDDIIDIDLRTGDGIMDAIDISKWKQIYPEDMV